MARWAPLWHRICPSAIPWWPGRGKEPPRTALPETSFPPAGWMVGGMEWKIRWLAEPSLAPPNPSQTLLTPSRPYPSPAKPNYLRPAQDGPRWRVPLRPGQNGRPPRRVPRLGRPLGVAGGGRARLSGVRAALGLRPSGSVDNCNKMFGFDYGTYALSQNIENQ